MNVSGGTVNLNIHEGALGGDPTFHVKSGSEWNQTGGTVNVNPGTGATADATLFEGTVTVDSASADMNINSTDGATFDGTVTVSNNATVDILNDLDIDGGTLSGGTIGAKGTTSPSM